VASSWAPGYVRAVGPNGPSGVLVVDKPRGPTSHDVVAHVRRVLRTREVGHAGTLDPMATGVLVLAVGEATKLVPWLTAHDKSYGATISLGMQTDTLDADGREDACRPPSPALLAALGRSRPEAVAPMLLDALALECARTLQIPPSYSAIKAHGERAFARARRGESVQLAPRPVRVDRLELLECSAAPPWLAIELDVGMGYYVRSLARDLAASLGSVGHLTALRRSRSGPFVAAEAVGMNACPDELVARLTPLALSAARALPVARLTETGVRDARCGRLVRASDINAPARGPSAWINDRGNLVAVGEADANGQGRVVRGFTAPAAQAP
jgi:tRNA pseudouridine55 synthase